jgi:hypothetical protein
MGGRGDERDEDRGVSRVDLGDREDTVFRLG